MFLLKQLWFVFDAVSIWNQIYQFMSTDFFGNLMGLLNVFTVIILFIIGLTLFRKQAKISTEIQLNELDNRQNHKKALEYLQTYFSQNISPLLKKAQREILNNYHNTSIHNINNITEIIEEIKEQQWKLTLSISREHNDNLGRRMYIYADNICEQIRSIHLHSTQLKESKPQKQEQLIRIIRSMINKIEKNILLLRYKKPLDND